MAALLSGHHYIDTDCLRAVLSSAIVKFIKDLMPQKDSSNVKSRLSWERRHVLSTPVGTDLLVLFCPTAEPQEVFP